MDTAQHFLAKHNQAVEQQIDHEADVIPPLMYRVYKSTVQKQIPNYLSLSSHAAFLILLDGESQVIAWIGSLCDEEDATLVREIGVEVMTHDYGNASKSIPIVYEQDDPSSPLVETFLDIFDIDGSVYNSKLTLAERRKPIENSSVSIGIMIPPANLKDLHLFELKETSYAHPDATGLVPRIPFPKLERNTIVYMNVGDHWDLWFSKNLSSALIDLSIKFIENLIEAQLSRTVVASISGGNDTDNDPASLKAMVVQYLQITQQGQERQCFRRSIKIFTDFEPFEDIKTILEHRQVEKGREEMPSAGNSITRESSSSNNHNNNSAKATNNNTTTSNTVSFATNKTGADMSPVIPKHATFWNISPRQKGAGGGGAAGGDFSPRANLMALNPQSSFRKNSSPPQQLEIIASNDIQAITPELLEIHDTWNIPLSERRALLQSASINPEVLLGWQVQSLLL